MNIVTSFNMIGIGRLNNFILYDAMSDDDNIYFYMPQAFRTIIIIIINDNIKL